MSAAFRRMERIADGLVLRHDLNAFCAASAACVASFGDAPDACQSVLCEAGDTTSNVVEVVTSFPSIQSGTV